MAGAQELVLHPFPQSIRYTHHNNDFSVFVRLPGEDWQDLYEYKVIVDMDNPQPASMVQFDFSGTVEVLVKQNYGVLRDALIRPFSKGIKPVIKGSYISFFLTEPAKVSVEVNGDRLHNLHVFANPLETEKPAPGGPDLIYFGEGIHVPEDGGRVFRIPSNKTVYLAPGAVVRGTLVCDRAENVRIMGRGILDSPERGFELKFSRNIEIDGITVINPRHYTVYGGQCDGLKIRNLKSFSSQGWSDGIDLMSCSNVDIEDIFMRNSDDCIAIYTHRWDFYGDAKNYRVKNAILWADIAHPVNIGLHGDTGIEGNVIENLRFSNIDILEHDEDDRNYQGCVAFSVSDHNLVRDAVFENIRIENITEGQLFNLRVLYNRRYSTAPGRGIENVTFRNIYYDYAGWPENPSVVEGYDEARGVKALVFENIVINGKRVKTFEEANIRIGKFTENVILK
ncbi:MAG: hypothetical protein LBF77_02950 [Spirochaetaceae bacterium]|jgi:hypothetical protein|nr:hypothetical protein [Spirochaetaceae bacterium]